MAGMYGKKMSPKQKKIAGLGGNKKKIDGADFKKLRNSTTAKKVMKKKKTRMA